MPIVIAAFKFSVMASSIGTLRAFSLPLMALSSLLDVKPPNTFGTLGKAEPSSCL